MTNLAAVQGHDLGESQGLSKTQFLTFVLDGQEYGIDIMNVMEIRQWERPTPLPRSPEFVKGIINLRGSIIPVVDLREKFLLNDCDYNSLTVVIVVQVKRGDSNKITGLVIDSVSDVLTLADDELQKTTTFVNNKLKEHIMGMYNFKEQIVTILDVDTISVFADNIESA